MQIREIIEESIPRTLYHGTLKEFLPDILDRGLLPWVGKFTAHAYDEYRRHGIPLKNVVFAADRTGLGKCVSAIIGQMRHNWPKWDQYTGADEITAADFYQHAALLVIKQGERRFKQRGEQDHSVEHPLQAEPQDWYTTDADYPDIVLTDKRLRNFLRRNNIRLKDYGIQDTNIDRAELVRMKIGQR